MMLEESGIENTGGAMSGRASSERFTDSIKVSWVFIVLLVIGLFAFLTAILIAWPALAYIASRFF